MSQHVISGLSAHYKIIVGYDPNLNNFFTQVHDNDKLEAGKDVDEELIFWTPFGVPNPEDLIEPLKPYAELTPLIIQMLRAEQIFGNDGSYGWHPPKCSVSECVDNADAYCDKCSVTVCAGHSWY